MNSHSSANLPLGAGVKIVAFHETGLFALEKPAGTLSHPNGSGVARNALLLAPYDPETECYHFREDSGAHRHAWLLNRLDSPTSGLILLATEESVAEEVLRLFAQRRVEKTYHAVVKGARILPPCGEWRDTLKKTGGGTSGFVRSSTGAGGAQSVTGYRTESSNRGLPGLSLLRLEPKTGRTHQLRVQTARHGHPILGDKTYGDFAMNKSFTMRDTRFDRLFLHCSRTVFTYAHHGREYKFEAESPLPEIFLDALGESAPTKVVSPRISVRLKPRR